MLALDTLEIVSDFFFPVTRKSSAPGDYFLLFFLFPFVFFLLDRTERNRGNSKSERSADLKYVSDLCTFNMLQACTILMLTINEIINLEPVFQKHSAQFLRWHRLHFFYLLLPLSSYG